MSNNRYDFDAQQVAVPNNADIDAAEANRLQRLQAEHAEAERARRADRPGVPRG